MIFGKLLREGFGSYCSFCSCNPSHRFHHIATGSSFRHNLVRHRTRSCSTFNNHIWLIVTAQMEAAFNLAFKNLPQVRLLPLWVISLLQLPRGPAKNHYPPHPRTRRKRSCCLAIIFVLTTTNPQIPPRLLSLSRLVLEEKPEPIKPEKTPSLRKHECFQATAMMNWGRGGEKKIQ